MYHLVGRVDNEAGCVGGWAGESVHSSQFCHEPQIALKKESFLSQKKILGKINNEKNEKTSGGSSN